MIINIYLKQDIGPKFPRSKKWLMRYAEQEVVTNSLIILATEL
jgi:hypothetical protein